jgi:hypothetical protein
MLCFVNLFLILLHIVALLSFENDRTQQIHSWPLRAGSTYVLKRVTTTADTRYCF